MQKVKNLKFNLVEERKINPGVTQKRELAKAIRCYHLSRIPQFSKKSEPTSTV